MEECIEQRRSYYLTNKSMDRETIMITGAAGFIGGQLAHKLYKLDYDLILVDNMSYGHEDNLIFDDVNLNEILYVMDIRSEEFEQLFKENKIDYIFNIAGIAPLPDCQSNPYEAVDVNTNGLVKILDLARIHGVQSVVQASTNAMYENVLNFPTKESDLNNTNKPTLIYPNTKYCAERFAESFCDTYGMNVACVRFANVYGPHIDCLRKQPPFVGYMIRELHYNRTPQFFSNGEQARDYIYVDDLLDLVYAARTVEGFEAINCSSGKSYSVKDLYAIASKIMNKNIDAEYNDSSKYWEKYPSLYEGAYSISEEVLDHEVNKFSQCDNEKAKRLFDWEPMIDIEEGLKRTIEYTEKMLEKIE